MNVRLVVKSGGAEPKTYRMTNDEMVIGRLKGCGLRVPSASVSRRHCRLKCADGIVRVEDLGSANGTLVNGTSVNRSALRPGDRLTIGPVTFEVQYALTPEAVDQLLHEDEAPVVAPSDEESLVVLERPDAAAVAPVEAECPEAIPLDESPDERSDEGILGDLAGPLAALAALEEESETLAEPPPPKPAKKKKKPVEEDAAPAKKPAKRNESPDYSGMMSGQEPWAMPEGDDLRDLLSRLEDEE